MYPRLELEMFKKKIRSPELARICGISETSMRNKRKGRAEFTLKEVKTILQVFPECSFWELFAREDEQGKAG